jgi:hypothetical protein
MGGGHRQQLVSPGTFCKQFQFQFQLRDTNLDNLDRVPSRPDISFAPFMITKIGAITQSMWMRNHFLDRIGQDRCNLRIVK